MYYPITLLAVAVAVLGCLPVANADPTQPWTTGSYYPAWAGQQPLRIRHFAYISSASVTQNGAALADTIARLQPGDRLVVAAGTYSVNRWWNLVLRGTAQNPVWIVAAPGATVVITRPDANQNLLNVAASTGDTTDFLCLRGLQFTGGSQMIRLYHCRNVWIDSCTLHDGGGAALTTNTANTEYIYLTRNHIYNPGPADETDEGMYLGANDGGSISNPIVMRYSIVALNHIHDCAGTQGDGIELKQGSYNNWIVENYVHDTQYPCILAYGTGGNGINVIERNTIHSSGDNAMQVQGEAIVRNNLIMDGAVGFASTDHQGQTVNLTVVHNTIVTAGLGCNLSSWNNRAGMVFANNVVYSRDQTSLRFPNGSTGVTLAGNVVFGPVSGATSGYVTGAGLADFVDVTWDATHRDAHPKTSAAMVGAANATYAVVEDINGVARSAPQVSGAFVAAGASVQWGRPGLSLGTIRTDRGITVDLLGRALNPLRSGTGSRVLVLTSPGSGVACRSVHFW